MALACDRIIARGDDFGFADLLVNDLTTPATIDDTVSDGPTMNTAQRRISSSHRSDGRWEPPASSQSCCGVPAFAKVTHPAMPSRGQTTPSPTTPTKEPHHGLDRKRSTLTNI